MANLSAVVHPSNVATLTGTQTLTNKTLTAPTISSPTISSPTLTGTVTLPSGVSLSSPSLASPSLSGAADVTGSMRQSIVAVPALDIDCSQGNFFTKTINANSTFTFSNPPSSRAFAFTLEVIHTSGTITWPTTVRWPGGTAPSLTTGRVHLFTFVTDDAGANWRGASQVNYTA